MPKMHLFYCICILNNDIGLIYSIIFAYLTTKERPCLFEEHLQLVVIQLTWSPFLWLVFRHLGESFDGSLGRIFQSHDVVCPSGGGALTKLMGVIWLRVWFALPCDPLHSDSPVSSPYR